MSELTNSRVVIVEFDANSQPNKVATDKLNEACYKAEKLGRDGVLVIKWCKADAKGSLPADEVNDELAVYQVSRWEKALRRVEKLDVATVAQVEADVTGTGMSLILLADYRISLKPLTFGLKTDGYILPGMVIHRLAHQIGGAHARKMVLLGQAVDAEFLLQLGLIDQIVAAPNQAVADLVESLEQSVITDIAVRRRLLLECLHQSYDEALGTHLAASDRMLRAMS